MRLRANIFILAIQCSQPKKNFPICQNYSAKGEIQIEKDKIGIFIFTKNK